MKFKLCRLIVISGLFISVGLIQNVNAALIDIAEVVVKNVTDTSANRELHVKGQTTSNKQGIVALKVKTSSVEPIDPEDSESILNVYNLFKQVETNSNGVYEYTYKIDGVEGEYTIYVADESGATADVKIMIVSEQSIINAHKAFNNIKNAVEKNDIRNVFETYSIELGIQMSITENVNNTSAVYNQIFLNKSKLNDIWEAVNLYKKSMVVQAINETDVYSVIGSYIEGYKEILEIESLNKYSVYTSILGSMEKAALYGYIGKSGIESYEEFMRFLDEQIILTAFSMTKSPGEVMPFLKLHSDLIIINYSTYESLNDNSTVSKALYNKYFKSIKLLVDAFNGEVNKQKNIEILRENTAEDSGGIKGSSSSTIRVSEVSPLPIYNNKAEALSEASKFKDLEEVEWAKESIEFLAEIGAISGDGAGAFYPNTNITREDFVKILIHTWNINNTNSKVEFKDTDDKEYYYSYVATAKQLGVVNGISEDVFGVGVNITREEVAAMVYRLLRQLNISVETAPQSKEITDTADISNYALESIIKMKNSGIISGYPDGSFRPKEKCTRAQAAKIIFETLQFSKNRNK